MKTLTTAPMLPQSAETIEALRSIHRRNEALRTLRAVVVGILLSVLGTAVAAGG